MNNLDTRVLYCVLTKKIHFI